MCCMIEPKACLHHKKAASRAVSLLLQTSFAATPQPRACICRLGRFLKLQCPCLFAHGDRDPLCPVERLTQTQQEMAQPCENIVIQVLIPSLSGKSCRHQLDLL